MPEGEGYRPSEADVKSVPEKKRSFRDLFKHVLKNWPSRVDLHRKMEEWSEHVHQQREQHLARIIHKKAQTSCKSLIE
jgi:hypothetical protein